MVPKCVENAIALLGSKSENTLDRETVVAYSFVVALAHYFPKLTTEAVKNALIKFKWVKDKEPSRLIKQRRIALTYILREVEASS